MLVKMTEKKRFKYFNLHNIFLVLKKPLISVKTIHEQLMTVDPESGKMPYWVFYLWVVETLQYGLVLTIVYVNLFIITGWMKYAMFVFSLGAIRWLWLDLVENTTNKIKGKT
jgi:hypothetical protein